MTHVSTEQQKYTPWFAKAGAACSIIPISRFVNDRIFALKGGGYGCLFSLAGIDEEGLTDQELDDFGIMKWPTSAVCFGPPLDTANFYSGCKRELGSGGGSWTGEPRWSCSSRFGWSMSLG